MTEGSGAGSIPLTNGSGSENPKNMWIRWIRIRNTGFSSFLWVTLSSWVRIYSTASYTLLDIPEEPHVNLHLRVQMLRMLQQTNVNRYYYMKITRKPMTKKKSQCFFAIFISLRRHCSIYYRLVLIYLFIGIT